jgi:hypothetical protein
MSVSSLDRKIKAEQKKKDKAAKRRAKPGKAKDTEETEDQKKEESVPVDLGDHKGARKVLRHAVKAAVKVKSEAIAQKLVNKAEEGDLHGTEMVLSLMEKKKQDKDAKKKKKRSGPSWAELLASEPEWDESMEENRDQGAGIRDQKASSRG